MRQFECFWGDGYRRGMDKSIMEYHDFDFFTELRGYNKMDIDSIDTLQVGEYAEFNESGDHWVRRIA